MKRTPPRTVFLDNNVWNALVDGSAPLAADQLVSAFRSGQVEVVATIELLEETLGTAREYPQKYDQMRRAARKLCGRRILIPLRERNIAEILTGGVLPAPGRYLPRKLIERVFALRADEDVVGVINDDVYERKVESGQRDRADVEAVLAAIEEFGATVNDFDHVVTVDMVRATTIDALALGAEHGFPTVPNAEVSSDRVPSLWWYCAASQASATRAAAAGMKPQDSDNHDRQHCSAGAYFNVLVTGDRKFRAWLDMVPDRPFDVVTPDEFAAGLPTP